MKNMKKTITTILAAAMLMTQMSGFDVFAAQNSGKGRIGGTSSGSAPAATITVPPTSTTAAPPEASAEPPATSTALPSNMHLIKYELDGGTNYENAPTAYTEGTELELGTPSKDGYAFDGWYIDADGDGAYELKISKIPADLKKDITLLATWLKEYKIDYRTGEGTLPEGCVTKYKKGDSNITLLTPTRDGYIFRGWREFDESTKTMGEIIEKIDTSALKDIVVVATWEKSNKINYVLNDGTNPDGAVTQFTKDSETFDLPTPKKDGFRFDGWYSNEAFEGEKITQIVKGTERDVTVYAKWVQEYKIIYKNMDGAVNFENAPQTFTADTETIVLGKPTKGESEFNCWKIDTNNDGVGDTVIEKIEKGTTNDVTLYAVWNEAFKITYETNGGVMPSTAPGTYKTGTVTKLVKPTRTGYSFEGWYTDEEFAHPISEITANMSGDITVYATWKRYSGGSLGGAKYYVHFDTGNGSSVSDQLLQSGATARKPENPTLKGYTFAGWYTTRDYSEKFDFDTKITKTITLYAKWTKIDGNDYVDDNFDKVLVLTIGSKEAKVNGKTVVNDVAPVLKNDRTMMPIRFIAENIGATVKWDPNFRIVTVNCGSKQVVIHINSDVAYVNGSIYNLDSAAYIENDRTYIPVRFLSEALDCEVEWNESNSKVYILKK